VWGLVVTGLPLGCPDNTRLVVTDHSSPWIRHVKPGLSTPLPLWLVMLGIAPGHRVVRRLTSILGLQLLHLWLLLIRLGVGGLGGLSGAGCHLVVHKRCILQMAALVVQLTLTITSTLEIERKRDIYNQ
jgi:hypothetical protein